MVSKQDLNLKKDCVKKSHFISQEQFYNIQLETTERELIVGIKIQCRNLWKTKADFLMGQKKTVTSVTTMVLTQHHQNC